MESAAIPASARIVLFFLIGLLLVVLGFLIAFAVVIRKRQPADDKPSTAAADTSEELVPVVDEHLEELMAVAVEEIVACPTCRREYDGELQFCPTDARKLVPASEMLERTRGGGAMCPSCRRAFAPGVRFCPHDAAELVPVSIFEATRGRETNSEPVGVLGKICPQCRERHDLSAVFCSHDGSELVALN